jgi:flagellar protein FlgJ
VPVAPVGDADLLNIARLRTAAVPVSSHIPAAQGTADVENASAGTRFSSPASFVQAMWPYAEKVGNSLNIAPEAVLAQSALESGWGNKVMMRPDGRSSFNLFGIEAGSGWQGDTVTVPTAEYVDGKRVNTMDTFRAYDSYADGFDDYMAFVSGNPRYQSALATGRDPAAFGHAMRQAGYATDPEYGNKISSILSGDVMHQTVAELKGETYAPLI